ncbi:MAG: murein transglycosylase A [Legionellales bacterium]
MNCKLKSILISVTCFALSFFWPLHLQPEKIQRPTAPSKKVPSKDAPAIKNTVTTAVIKRQRLKTVAVNNNAANNISLMKVPFTELPGWDDADVKKSFIAFQNSCETFLKQDPGHSVGSIHINVKAGDWHPACAAALSIKSVTEDSARVYFEKWFNPIKFEQKKPAHGLFTGYYMPRLEGSLKRTTEFSTPIYALPKTLTWNTNKTRRHQKARINYTREQIDNGALGKKAPVIAWINSPVERLFLEIEGSGVIKLPSGENLYVSYAGENGAPYTSIGSVLIKKGLMTRNNASKAAIKRYLENHPSKMNAILHQNKSFVFFQSLKEPAAMGAKGMSLTPGYSLAIDKKWIPMGAPLWLDTKKPNQQNNKDKAFHRLMIAQDTGGAIRGLMRGDIYWGAGKKAAFLGEHMKNTGRYWLLLPKYAINRLAKKFSRN